MNDTTVKRFYNNGLWSLSMVRVAVRKGIITKTQFKKITGKTF